MSITTSLLNTILDDARTFYKNKQECDQEVSWADYERFKQQLQNAGLYGFESELAESLHM